MSEELKPCPFCSCKLVWDTDHEYIEHRFKDDCPLSDRKIRVEWFGSEEELIKAWNTRTPPKVDVEFLKKEYTAFVLENFGSLDMRMEGISHKFLDHLASCGLLGLEPIEGLEDAVRSFEQNQTMRFGEFMQVYHQAARAYLTATQEGGA